MTENKKYIYILALVCAAIFFSNLDVIYVNIMEARNFITAREMLQNGNWIHTTMNLEPRYEKPPLPTWLTAFSASIFGLNSLFGLRLPAVLSATFLVIVLYLFSIKLLNNKKQALVNALILTTSFFIIFSGRNGQWDIFSHAFMLFAIFQLFQAFQNKTVDWKNWILAGVFLGLSFMSKGPVSHFALLLPFLISYGIVYKFNSFKIKWVPLTMSILIFIIVGLSWGLYIYISDGSSADAIADKETNAWSNRNVRPFYYYWSFFTQSGIWTFFAFISLLYPFMMKRINDKKGFKFSFLWTVIAVVLLSLIPEKKSRYLLPVLIPLAINTGFYIYFLIDKKSALLKVDKGIGNFGFGLIGLIGIVFPIGAYFFFGEKLDGFWVPYILTSVSLFAIGLAIFYALKKVNFESAFYLTILFMCSVMVFGMPMARMFYSNESFKNISELRGIEGVESKPLFILESISPELMWELGEPIKNINSIDELPKQNSFGLLVNDSISTEIKNTFDYKFVEQFDINYVDKSKKGYKERLTSKLYLLEKK